MGAKNAVPLRRNGIWIPRNSRANLARKEAESPFRLRLLRVRVMMGR